jgi:hypothetical protein
MLLDLLFLIDRLGHRELFCFWPLKLRFIISNTVFKLHTKEDQDRKNFMLSRETSLFRSLRPKLATFCSHGSRQPALAGHRSERIIRHVEQQKTCIDITE